MLAKRIIPCLDVKDGRVVKGVQFVDLRDAGDPVEAAMAYDAQHADELVFLDITASHENRKIMLDVVARTAEGIYMPLTVGGGIRGIDDVRALLRAGADKVSLNTAALERPALIREAAERFGSQCIVVAIDARRVPGTGAWSVYTHGGRRPTGRWGLAHSTSGIKCWKASGNGLADTHLERLDDGIGEQFVGHRRHRLARRRLVVGLQRDHDHLSRPDIAHILKTEAVQRVANG